jgi:alkylation response protein AidB-like acyl-CoA dehydrogenase
MLMGPGWTAKKVACGNLEHKMGIKANATCVMNFDDATGWLVGEPHQGLKAMFTMMNAARLGVAMQGLGIAEIAYQNALAYARDRLQMRALDGARNIRINLPILLLSTRMSGACCSPARPSPKARGRYHSGRA